MNFTAHPINSIFICLVWTSIVTLPLALPLVIWWRRWPKFILAMILTNGLLLPIIAFLGSILLGPEWKGDCPNGWIDCMSVAKLALTPLVLWASAAWYAVEIRQVSDQTRARPWIVLGFLHGAIVSSVCCLYLLARLAEEVSAHRGFRFEPNTFFVLNVFLIPFYVAATYSIRSAQLMRAARLKLATYLKSLLIALPCWIGSLIWSKQIYDALPDKPPEGCFVVTAASHGHPAFVGPFTEITHRGRSRRANQQLVTFWQFEELWRRRAPTCHTAFRRIYNRVGPMLARRLRHRWLADLAWLVLKPAELFAGLVTRNTR